MKIEKLQAPPYLWRYEEFLLLVLSCWAWARLTRRIFASAFVHENVRWVRKFRYPPGGLIPFCMYVFAATMTAVVASLFFNVWTQTALLQSSVLLADYIPAVLILGGLFFTVQTSLGACARKLMVEGEDLVLKSAGYRSRRIALLQIDSLTLIAPWKIIFHPAILLRCLPRFHFYDIFVWRSAVLMKTSSGKYYVFAITEPAKALRELNSFVLAAKEKHNVLNKVA